MCQTSGEAWELTKLQLRLNRKISFQLIASHHKQDELKIAALLQGSWQALDDAKNKFTINRTVLTTYYDGKKRTTNTVAYVAECGAMPARAKKASTAA